MSSEQEEEEEHWPELSSENLVRADRRSSNKSPVHQLSPKASRAGASTSTSTSGAAAAAAAAVGQSAKNSGTTTTTASTDDASRVKIATRSQQAALRTAAYANAQARYSHSPSNSFASSPLPPGMLAMSASTTPQVAAADASVAPTHASSYGAYAPFAAHTMPGPRHIMPSGTPAYPRVSQQSLSSAFQYGAQTHQGAPAWQAHHGMNGAMQYPNAPPHQMVSMTGLPQWQLAVQQQLALASMQQQMAQWVAVSQPQPSLAHQMQQASHQIAPPRPAAPPLPAVPSAPRQTYYAQPVRQTVSTSRPPGLLPPARAPSSLAVKSPGPPPPPLPPPPPPPPIGAKTTLKQCTLPEEYSKVLQKSVAATATTTTTTTTTSPRSNASVSAGNPSANSSPEEKHLLLSPGTSVAEGHGALGPQSLPHARRSRETTQSDSTNLEAKQDEKERFFTPRLANARSSLSGELDTPSSSRVSRYAQPFVPAWMRQVAIETPVHIVPLVRKESIDWQAWRSTFLPPALATAADVEHEAGERFVEEEVEGASIARTPTSSPTRRFVPSPSEGSRSGPIRDWRDKEGIFGSDFDPTLPESGSESGSGSELQSDAASELDVSSAEDQQTRSMGPLMLPDQSIYPLQSARRDGAAHQTQSIGAASPDLTNSKQNPLLKPSAATAMSTLVPALDAQHYARRFTMLLRNEMDFRAEELAGQTLYGVGLEAYDAQRGRPRRGDHNVAVDRGLWNLKLPGIREEYPKLQPGDLVRLRPIVDQGWIELEYEARVWALRTVEGIVVLKCDEIEEGMMEQMGTSMNQARFVVLFSGDQSSEVDVIACLKRVQQILANEDRPAAILKRWLFPLPQHSATTQSKASSELDMSIAFEGQGLNPEQKVAVESIAMRQHRVPFLIQGPPGTGKTRTLVAACLSVLQRNAKSSILLCAPSNEAADTLALRLVKSLNRQQLIRINAPGRTFAELPEALVIYSHIENTDDGAHFGLPPWTTLMKARIIVTATHDVPLLLKSRGVSNADLGRLEATIYQGLRPAELAPDVPLHFTHLFIDEASQGTEAQTLSALLAVLPSRHTKTQEPSVVLCGDTKQLGPHVHSPWARAYGLDVSMLERLSGRDAYRHRLRALRTRARNALLTGSFDNEDSPDAWAYSPSLLRAKLESGSRTKEEHSCAQLVRNYRQRDARLLQTPSSLYYDECLLPCAKPRVSALPIWSGLPNPDVPIRIEHVEGSDEWVDEGSSWFNLEEARRVVDICRSLTGLAPSSDKAACAAPAEEEDANARGSLPSAQLQRIVGPREISVISPFREQVWCIRLALRSSHHTLKDVNVGHCEVFQGAEHPVSIISTVRTRERFLDNDAKRSMGLLFERKRLCVTLTRCQDMLIVLGCAPLLAKDEDWAALLEHSMRHGAYVGPSLANLDPASGRGISALEAAAAAETLVSGVQKRHRDRSVAARVQHDRPNGVVSASSQTEEDDDDDGDDDDDDEVNKAMALVVGRMTAAALLDEDDEGWT
ncbi:P-loop containing nucleoside triphosphate hydrolase protein [Ceraceosorus guamensis]|uniref:P-loop containing nucleoside triphosphate hydrolase protein n=1 Tax=Ceraceosorus guamensis TaxID=1522189 RepID=A0A316VPA5_9BASI|nr:P-loop containing nucleoside triphosphate hydrolase protein [Ceraceosorus guamensis]PWN39144.1 P-loop containing nucleoside triphosphate hydrolase protein [Ceraceosorus guamensis]